MKKLCVAGVLLSYLTLTGTRAVAQTIAPGTFELSAVTSAAGNRQTVSVNAPAAAGVGEVGLTALNLGLETTYYIDRWFGLGVLVSHQRLSIDAPDRDVVARLSASYFGPLAQTRLPLDERSSVVVAASFGGIHTGIVNRNTGISQNLDLNAYGRYWLAGGGMSFAVRSNASFDGSVRYQSSTFSAPVEQGGVASASGLLVQIGFSLYFQ